MKKLLIICLLITTIVGYTQPFPVLYKGLYYKMPIEAAKQEFKKHKADYTTISFGNGVDYRLYPQNFGVVNDSLTSLILTPKGAVLGLSHESAKVYLINSFEFFKTKGYKILKEGEFWEVPIFFKATNKFGMVMFNPEKTIVVELRSVPITNTSYTVNLGISNYNAYMRYLEADEHRVKQQQNTTGF